MPDHKICLTGQRTAELQQFDDLAATWSSSSSPGLLRTPSSLLGDRCDFSRLSSGFLAKDFDAKPSLSLQCRAAVAGGPSLNALLNTSSQRCPLAINQSLDAAAAAAAVADVSETNISTTASRKFAPRRGRSLKPVRSGPLLREAAAAACAVVKSLERNGDAVRSVVAGKRKPQSWPSWRTENVEIASESRSSPQAPPEYYRGVRIRPGVKGFLVEIRPRKWKKTIWLGTYTTSPEAARAYDAGIFYTGKKIPFNFRESEGSFPPLPAHLSLADSDPEVMEQIKWFVKEQAQEAATRAAAAEVPPPTQEAVPPQTSNASDNEGRSSVGSQYDCHSTLFSGEEEARGRHVKDEGEEHDGCNPIMPNPFQTLEPLSYNLLPHCSKQALCNNDRDFWGGIPLASFLPLPAHLSLTDFDPEVMEQIKWFMREQALEAAKRTAVADVRPLTEEAVPPQTSKVSYNKGRSSVGSQYNCCCTLFSGEEEARDGHVNDEEEEHDGCNPIMPNPFQNLEPLPYNLLPHCSKQALCNNDRDVWGGILLAAHEYMPPQTGMAGDEDLLGCMQQISCLTEQVLSNPWQRDEQKQWRDEAVEPVAICQHLVPRVTATWAS